MGYLRRPNHAPPRARAALFRLCAVLVASGASAQEDYVRIGKDARWGQPRPDMADLSVQFIMRSPHLAGLQPEYTEVDDPVAGEGPTGPVKFKNAELAGAGSGAGGRDGAGVGPGSHVPPGGHSSPYGRVGWPKAGEKVTFTAVVRNAGTRAVAGFDWAWLFDGRDVSVGRQREALGPDETALFTLERAWQEGPHFVAFQVDRERLVDEISAENNWVIDRTDALSLTFFVEEGVAKFFQTVQSGLNSYSFEDWAQFQVREMNREFRDTIYPSCPDGITERVRLDRVYRIPDGWGDRSGMHTPRVLTPVDLENPQFVSANEPAEGVPAEVFSNINGGTDGVWGFAVDLLTKKAEWGGRGFYEHQSRWLTGPEWPLHHELGHQLGRADHYLMATAAEANEAAPGLKYEPPRDYRDCMMYAGNHAHDAAIGRNREKWDSAYRFYSEHLARSFNRDRGVRRGLFGEYLFDVPKQNEFLILGPDGKPAAGAAVDVFVARGRGYTNAGFNARPEYSLRTDAEGVLRLDRSPWKHVFIWATNAVVMFRATPAAPDPDSAPVASAASAGTSGGMQDTPAQPAPPTPVTRWIGFVDISQFNLAYWRGHEEQARFTVTLSPWTEPAAATSQPASVEPGTAGSAARTGTGR